MALFMLQSLQKAPRIHGIKEKGNYWLTILNPPCNGKVAEFFLPLQREQKMKHLEKVLQIGTFYPPFLRLPVYFIMDNMAWSLLSLKGRAVWGGGGEYLSEAFKRFFMPRTVCC